MVWCKAHNENHHGKMRKYACELAKNESESFARALEKARILGRRKKRMRFKESKKRKA